jgi:hypothetical protein
MLTTATSLAKEVLETRKGLSDDIALGQSEEVWREGGTVLHRPHFVVAQVHELELLVASMVALNDGSDLAA